MNFSRQPNLDEGSIADRQKRPGHYGQIDDMTAISRKRLNNFSRSPRTIISASAEVEKSKILAITCTSIVNARVHMLPGCRCVQADQPRQKQSLAEVDKFVSSVNKKMFRPKANNSENFSHDGRPHCPLFGNNFNL